MAIQNKRSAWVCTGLAVSSALFAAAAQAQSVSFEEAWNFAVGTTPTSVAVGDFNGDGVQDLAVTNGGTDPFYADSGVSVLLGNADRSFQSPRIYQAGRHPYSVAVGDFNGDGVPDLAVANLSDYSRGTVSVLLGNGNGSFQPAQNFDAGGHPSSIAVGDFNGDGLQDLAVTIGGDDPDSGDVAVLLGNGDGSFQAARNFAAGPGPVSVAVGDFNGDGLQDLAIANRSSDTVSVLLGNGDGSFLAARHFGVGNFPSSVAVGDFNGDEVQDLAVATNYSGVWVLLGNGDGSFQAARNFAAGRGAVSVAVGDFNGDGIQDLAVADLFFANVAVLLCNGDGSFQPHRNFLAESMPYSVAVSDINGDGLPDLVVANYNSYSVSVLFNNTPIGDVIVQ